MRIFTEILLSDVCYIQEAVLWLAFGRPPRFSGNEDEQEARRYGDVEHDGTGEPAFYGYWPSEFLMHGIEIDFDRYSLARELYEGMTGAEYLARTTRWVDAKRHAPDEDDETPYFDGDGAFDDSPFGVLARAKEPTREWSDDEVAAMRQQLHIQYADEAAEADWAVEQEGKLDNVVDTSWARLFVELSRGTIKAEGWRAFTSDEMALNDGQGPADGAKGMFEMIPATAWTMSGAGWSADTLATLDRLSLSADRHRRDVSVVSEP